MPKASLLVDKVIDKQLQAIKRKKSLQEISMIFMKKKYDFETIFRFILFSVGILTEIVCAALAVAIGFI